MNPVLIYVDDEPHNLTVLEALVPEEWKVITFDSATKALEKINEIAPWIVIADQRMPAMNGVALLELVKKVSPSSMRVIVTGHSDEDLVIDSVRKAQIHEYIRKPWDPDDVVHRLDRLISTYKLERELKEKSDMLVVRNRELEESNKKLEQTKNNEVNLRKELEAWAPPFILNTLTGGNQQFPVKENIAVIAYDIKNSSDLHGVEINGKSARNVILSAFTEIVLKNGGWRDSHAGDSAYAHFGFLKKFNKPADICQVAAEEFKLFLNSLSVKSGVEVECGIGLHMANQCIIDIQTLKFVNDGVDVIYKSFQTASTDVDLVHRMEKLAHSLPGTNMALSEEFIKSLSKPPMDIVDVGTHNFKGQKSPTHIFLRPSQKVDNEIINSVKTGAPKSA